MLYCCLVRPPPEVTPLKIPGNVIHGEDVGRVVGRMKGEVGRVAWEMGLEDVKGSNDINK